MKLPRRNFLHLAAGAAALPAVSRIARAQSYPTRPITMIVPFPAGGVIDPIARILTDRMRVTLGQPIIIENVVGAGGSIGLARAARAAPDGYLVVMGNWLSNVASGGVYLVRYDPLNDFEPIALLSDGPVWIVTKKDFPAANLNELIAWLKANPDKATAATVGPGSASHVTGVYFQNGTGTRFQFVPYRGGNFAIQDLLGGRVDLMFDQASNSLSLVRNGQIKAFAVMSSSRWFAAPDIPTVDELGLSGLHISFWSGFWAPKGTPKEVIAKLNAAAVEALADPTVRQRLADFGQVVAPREQQTPEALAAHHKAEIEKWWPIIKAANIKAE